MISKLVRFSNWFFSDPPQDTPVKQVSELGNEVVSFNKINPLEGFNLTARIKKDDNSAEDTFTYAADLSTEIGSYQINTDKNSYMNLLMNYPNANIDLTGVGSINFNSTVYVSGKTNMAQVSYEPSKNSFGLNAIQLLNSSTNLSLKLSSNGIQNYGKALASHHYSQISQQKPSESLVSLKKVPDNSKSDASAAEPTSKDILAEDLKGKSKLYKLRHCFYDNKDILQVALDYANNSRAINFTTVLHNAQVYSISYASRLSRFITTGVDFTYLANEQAVLSNYTTEVTMDKVKMFVQLLKYPDFSLPRAEGIAKSTYNIRSALLCNVMSKLKLGVESSIYLKKGTEPNTYCATAEYTLNEDQDDIKLNIDQTYRLRLLYTKQKSNTSFYTSFDVKNKTYKAGLSHLILLEFLT